MTLEEIKNAFVAEVEKVWHELTGTVDLDKARAVIADSAATLTGHVSALGQHLFDHVLGNAEQAAAAPAGEVPAAEQPLATGGIVTADPALEHPAPFTAPDTAAAPETVVVGEPGPELATGGGHAAGDSNGDAAVADGPEA